VLPVFKTLIQTAKKYSMVTNIIIGIIVLHLIVGFGYLVYKLSPREGDEELEDE
jgi:hypothetical protein